MTITRRGTFDDEPPLVHGFTVDRVVPAFFAG